MSRKAMSGTASHTQTNMAEAGLIGSGLIRDYIRGKDSHGVKVKPLSNTKLLACIKAVEHAIGLPKAKLYVKTDALSMKEVSEMAATWDEDSETVMVPTKPLTARQLRERVAEKVEQN